MRRAGAGLGAAVRRHGFREYSDARTGAGGFGWSTLVADLATGRGAET